MGFVIVGVALLFFAIIIGMLVLVKLKPDLFIKSTKSNGNYNINGQMATNSYSKGEVGDTKAFYPVKEIGEYYFDLGNYNYRAAIEVSSINLNLMSETEEAVVDGAYKAFLNSLRFPIEIYIQTREYDYTTILNSLNEQCKKAVNKFPTLANYAHAYQLEMQGLPSYHNNEPRTKRKFIIVPFDNTELSNMSELSASEIRQFALTQLMNRCDIVMSGLSGVGLNVELLYEADLAELVYAYYHRSASHIARNMIDERFDNPIVERKNAKYPNIREKLDVILSQAENSIKSDLVNGECTNEDLEYLQYICQCLEWFKQDDRTAYIGDLMRATADQAYYNGYGEEYQQFAENYKTEFDYSNYDLTGIEELTAHYLNN